MNKAEIYSPEDITIHITTLIKIFQKANIRKVYLGISEDIICGLERLQVNALVIQMNWHGDLDDKAVLRLALAVQGWISKEKLKEQEVSILLRVEFAERMNRRYKVANKSK